MKALAASRHDDFSWLSAGTEEPALFHGGICACGCVNPLSYTTSGGVAGAENSANAAP